METSDPDVLAQLYVMQWLHENGYHDALRALEKQLGKLYDDTRIAEASQLMNLVWRHVEERLQQQEEDEAAERATNSGGGARRRRQEDALRLLRSGCDDYAGRSVVLDVPAEVHRANVIAVRMVPGRDLIFTGTGDGIVRCLRYALAGDGAGQEGGSGCGNSGCGPSPAADVVWESRVGSAAVLSLALHPDYSSGLPILAVGSMDGRVMVLHGSSGATLAATQPHNKYVVRVAWGGRQGPARGSQEPKPAAPSATSTAEKDEVGSTGRGGGSTSGAPGSQQQLLLVSASMDETIAVQRLDLVLDPDPKPERAAGDTALPGSGAGSSGRLELVKQIPYNAAVTDAAFLRDGRTLVVSVRGSNYLRLLDTEELLARQQPPAAGGAAGSAVTEQLLNMNEAGDDHVSYTAKQLVPSPCGLYLLVCTDTPRLLVLRTSDWSHLRLLFGLPVDQFLQPVGAWHRDSHYVYVAGANAKLCVFHLGSGRLVHTARHHRNTLRDLDYDPLRNLIASGSFDKTVKIASAAPLTATPA